MRFCFLFVVLASCASPGHAPPGGESLVPAGEPLPIVRVTYRQFYAGSVPFVMENLSSRDLVTLRSEPIAPGEPPVAYVPDDVMREMLVEFERAGLPEYLRPRPSDPAGLGAVAEVTLRYPDGRTRCFLRTRGSGDADAGKTYLRSLETFRAVWNQYHPVAQVSTGDAGEFGVKKAGYGRD